MPAILFTSLSTLVGLYLYYGQAVKNLLTCIYYLPKSLARETPSQAAIALFQS